jgi:hypothetical protein
MQLPTLGLDRALLESVTAPLEKLPDETTAEQIRAGDVMGIIDRAMKGAVSSETLGCLTPPSQSFREGRFGTE